MSTFQCTSFPNSLNLREGLFSCDLCSQLRIFQVHVDATEVQDRSLDNRPTVVAPNACYPQRRRYVNKTPKATEMPRDSSCSGSDLVKSVAGA